MKICITQNISIDSILDAFFAEHSEIEPWIKIVYRIMFKKGVTSFNIDEKHLEIYVENGALNIVYSTEEQEK